jgi:hypothetical protein
LALTKDAIFKLPRPHNGQVAYATDTQETYIYNNGWQVFENIKVEGKGLNMNLYDLNKSIIAQLNDITNFTDAINLINEFKEQTKNNYYMLYAKDISYFTIFHIEKYGEFMNIGDGVVECLHNIGQVKSIDYTEAKDAIEIWIQQDEEIICAYLFPYDNGIVTIEEV